MPDRLQTRLELHNLPDVRYVGKRLMEMSIEYAAYLGGRSPSRWLREVAVELIRRADQLDAQSPLDGPDEPADPVVVQIMAARNAQQIERIERAYPDRWSGAHEQARRARLAELAG